MISPLGSRMRLIMLVLCSAISLSACGDQAAIEKQRKIAKISEAKNAERAVARSAEAAIMSDPEKALLELEKRLSDRITRHPGQVVSVIFDSGTGAFSLKVLPISSPWQVHCSPEGLKIWLGSGLETSSEDIGGSALVNLTEARLSEQMCRAISPAIARKFDEFLRLSNNSR